MYLDSANEKRQKTMNAKAEQFEKKVDVEKSNVQGSRDEAPNDNLQRLEAYYREDGSTSLVTKIPICVTNFSLKQAQHYRQL